MVKRDELVPVSRQQLKHKIRGRSVYAAKFQAKKHYDLDDIRKFAKKHSKNLHGLRPLKIFRLRIITQPGDTEEM